MSKESKKNFKKLKRTKKMLKENKKSLKTLKECKKTLKQNKTLEGSKIMVTGSKKNGEEK